VNLIKELQTGNQSAFESLFHRHKDMVFKAALPMLRDPQEAEDVVQEVFLKVHKRAGQFRGEEWNFRGWLRRITLNECASRLRRNGLHQVSFEKICGDGFDPPQDDSLVLPEKLLLQKEEQTEAQNLLALLSEKHYLVMVLRYYHELSYNEIAQLLEIPPGTVRSRLSTAIRTLRQAQEPDNGANEDEGFVGEGRS
jgi:RNA polymerase sigma factor (sigma-70 family)